MAKVLDVPPPKKDFQKLLAASAWAQLVLAVIGVLAVCYFARLVMLTVLISVLFAFVLSPLVDALEKLRTPRWAGSLVAVALLLACAYGLMYFSYNQAVSFAENLPKYSKEIREVTVRFQRQAQQIEETAETILPDATNEQTVKVEQQTKISEWLTNSAATLGELALAVSIIPFLVYFILSGQEHTRDATVRLFRPQNQARVNRLLRDIAAMLRGFIAGNFICGLFMTAISVLLFAVIRLPYFHFLGVISGFANLVPYFGVVLAALPPILAGLGVLEHSTLLWMVAALVGIHTFTLNFLFPKVIGRRLNLNPVVVTIALLFWGWLWGAIGFVLAIPITGALKITFDHVDSLRRFGAWMGEDR